MQLHHRIAFALRVVTAVYRDADFDKWAQAWLSGADRSAKSAQGVLRATETEKQAAHDLEDLAAWGGAGGVAGMMATICDSVNLDFFIEPPGLG